MITNLFSIFDPVSRSFLRNWTSVFWVFLIIATPLFSNKRPLLILINSLIKAPLTDLAENLSKPRWHVFTILVSIFLVILIINTLGLFSFNFTATRHIVFTLTFSLPFWLSFTLYSLTIKTKHFLAHLVPLGTPPLLIPFMVLIETISSLMRPLTLSIRLSANIVAGHLLLSLLGNFRAFFTAGAGAIIAAYAFFILELAVALIQRYVFVVLLSLYLEEA